MAEPDYIVKRNDYGWVINGQFLDAAGAPIPVTGFLATKLFMQRLGSDAIKLNGVEFNITDSALGKWNYVGAQGDADTSGKYKLELEVLLPSGLRTFPTNKDKPYLIVLVQDDLGGVGVAGAAEWSLNFSLWTNSGYLASV